MSMDTEIGVAEWLRSKEPETYRVSLAKVEGNGRVIKLGETVKGYAGTLPEIGQRYQIYTEEGRVLRTSEVVNIGNGYVKTTNSVYKIEIIQ
jgi:hypothetical protein